MPRADTQAMNLHLIEISTQVAPGAHAIVIIDGAGWHTTKSLIAPDNISLLRLPPYSPEFNPIENAFSKLKSMLRKAATRTVETLWSAIGRIVDAFTPAECANYFAAAGYDPA
jgi:transposase